MHDVVSGPNATAIRIAGQNSTNTGSTFSVLGRNPIMSAVREMPVVGGTGGFRMARGYCLASTRSLDQMDAVIGYNVTLFHY
ncbi:Dirigent protein 1 [Linum grandiflorum]